MESFPDQLQRAPRWREDSFDPAHLRSADGVTRILWTNLEDEARFRRNYRAKGITIEAEGNPFVVPQNLQDTPGEQGFDFATIRANFIIITVQSVYQAEVVEGTEPFDELAIEEITVIGRRAEATTNTTNTETTTHYRGLTARGSDRSPAENERSHSLGVR